MQETNWIAQFFFDHAISVVVFLPLAGALFLFFLPKREELSIKIAALTFMLWDFFLSIYFLFKFKLTHEMQFVEKIPWIPSFGGIEYHVGIDGISILLVLLATFLGPIVILCSWTAVKKRVKGYYINMLLLQTGMLGVFVALDLFLFYIFWEAMLIPMYFLIGIWGGERRIYAAIKFFLYTLAGSLLMLVAILAMVFIHRNQTGMMTFNLFELYNTNLTHLQEILIFSAFALAFAIKVPMFPFHTWLPDAHVEAPTAGSVVLAGVLLKMGTYGFLRFNMPLFPTVSQEAVPYIAYVAIIGIIYGALVAMVQKDVKKLVAYSSVSHLGFVMLGMFTFTVQGMQGSIIQMINHGLSTGALFLIVGIIYERRHTRLITSFGGLSKEMPVFAVFFMIATLSSIGLPGLNGFVGEFLILLGAFQVNKLYAVLAASGVILAAVYMLWMFQRVMFGEVTLPQNRGLKDVNLREWSYMLPVLFFIVLIGIKPTPFLKLIEPSVEHLIMQVKTEGAVDLIEDDVYQLPQPQQAPKHLY